MKTDTQTRNEARYTANNLRLENHCEISPLPTSFRIIFEYVNTLKSKECESIQLRAEARRAPNPHEMFLTLTSFYYYTKYLGYVQLCSANLGFVGLDSN